ncbi:MAG: cupin domain-containing protein [Flavobacterium sp.]|nr:MAG: cupin domain-containing protein [Flavobacterium sp.]
MNEISEIISKLELKPHPEGGYFRETYRSAGSIPKDALGGQYSGDRNYATAIYYLITSQHFSAFHKITQDETWHYYDGAAMCLHIISPTGEYKKLLISNNLSRGELPQFTVPGGYWFASEVSVPDSYSLMGCTVAPGFSFEDFIMPKREELLTLFPQHHQLITNLTHG